MKNQWKRQNHEREIWYWWNKIKRENSTHYWGGTGKKIEKIKKEKLLKVMHWKSTSITGFVKGTQRK